MHFLRYVVPACALLLAVSSPVQAGDCDCPGTPGYVLDLPETVALGESFDVCLQAPGGSLVFILVSAGSGPLPTKFGMLCVGVPFITLWPLDMPAEGVLCLEDHNVPCDEELIGFTAYFQFVALGPGAGQAGISNSQCLTAVNGGKCIPPGDYYSYTQGGWGAKCAGNNPGCLRDANFDTVYPGSLIVGDQDGDDADSSFALVMTSSQAVEDFLPDGGPSSALSDDEVDVANSSAGNLAGQLIAARLNVDFDDAGVLDGLKNQVAIKLGDLVYVDGVNPVFFGETVRSVLDLADKAISGEELEPFDVDSDLIGDVTFEELKDAVEVVNTNFDDGNQNQGNLAEP